MWPLQKEKSSLPRGNESVGGSGRAKRFEASQRVTALSSTGLSAHGMLVSISGTFGCNLFVPDQGRVFRGYS